MSEFGAEKGLLSGQARKVDGSGSTPLNSPVIWGGSFCRQNLGWELQGVWFSWLAGGEATGSGLMTLEILPYCLGLCLWHNLCWDFSLLAIYLASLTFLEFQRADGQLLIREGRRCRGKGGASNKEQCSLYKTMQNDAFEFFCRV